jgi:hypothetical protein
MTFHRIAITLFAVGAIALGSACSQETKKEVRSDAGAAGKDVERAADTVRGNVENSADTMAETYDKEREKGEGRVEAAGDSYNKVLEEGK